MTSVKFTGERIIPEVDNYFFREHVARYRFAKEMLNNSQSLIDVGCGDGYGTFYLSAYVKDAVGIDVSKEAVNAAKQKYRNANLTYKCVDPDDWDFPAENFDVATCFEVFEHVHKPEEILRNISQCLKDDGLLIISTPNKEVYGENLPDPYHIIEYSLNEFTGIVSDFFEIQTIYGQRNKNQMSKKFNFWLARQAMRKQILMTFFGWVLSFKKNKYVSPEQLNEVPVDDNYFSEESPADADYFIIIGTKK